MIEKFTPIMYLDEKDQRLLEDTKKSIKNAKTVEELRYLESVLDMLMKLSLHNYRKDKEANNELQKV